MVYTLRIKKTKEKIVRLNTIISTKLKVKSINDVALTTRASIKLRVIQLGLVLCIFVMMHMMKYWRLYILREELHYGELILEGEV